MCAKIIKNINKFKLWIFLTIMPKVIMYNIKTKCMYKKVYLK